MHIRQIIAIYVNIAANPITNQDFLIKKKIVYILWNALNSNSSRYESTGLGVLKDGDIYFTAIPHFNLQLLYFSNTHTLYELNIFKQTIRRANKTVEDVNKASSYIKALNSAKDLFEEITIGDLSPNMVKSSNSID